MSEVFISYSELDAKVGEYLHKSCNNFGIDAFLARISLLPGQRWKGEILYQLERCNWFFFLATENSIKSDACKHEIGAALALKKQIIPILFGIDYEQLPAWIKEYHGIQISNNNTKALSEILLRISEKRSSSENMILGVLAGALIMAGSLWLAGEIED